MPGARDDRQPATPAHTPDEIAQLDRLAYGSAGLALMGIALLSGGSALGWLLRAVGGTVGMLAVLMMILVAIATVHPPLRRALPLSRSRRPE